MKRLFLATFLAAPAKQALKQVCAANYDLEERWRCRVRWVNDEKLHLTWLYLGDLEEGSISTLESHLSSLIGEYQSQPDRQAAALHPGSINNGITFDQLEIWFAQESPRHLVLTPSSSPPPSLRLIDRVRCELINFVHPDYQAQASGEFRPHVTLLRFDKRDKQKPSLPVSNATGNHPLHKQNRLKVRLLETQNLREMVPILPLYHGLSPLCLVESTKSENVHQYSILRSFDLY